MLRNRSRAVSSKQALMAEQSSLPSPTAKPEKPISSFLNSPRFFNGFLTKTLSEAENVAMSPTSILDSKHLSNFTNPFGYDRNLPKPPSPPRENSSSCHRLESEGIGLALIDSINDEKKDSIFTRPFSRMALFSANLKVQIPNFPSSLVSPVESPKSPADFGIKTRNSHSPSPFSKFGSPSSHPKDSPQIFTRQLSLKEMELSEDYTCVITHGPNPKTTHIFDNCIVESCCGVVKLPNQKKEFDSETSASTSPSANFLSFCHNCKDILGEGKDIYMYRGDKAFCSHECRCQEMLFEGMENPEIDDAAF